MGNKRINGCAECDKLTSGNCENCRKLNETYFPTKPLIPVHGWICPKCGYVWAIWVDGCKNCNHLASQR